jgi:hypothetical protein
MERMALQQPETSENYALQQTVLFQRKPGIVGTGGVKATGVHQKWGYKPLIKYDQFNQ